MTKTTNVNAFGTCACEDITAISGEADRPCLDLPVDDEDDVVAASVEKEACTAHCAKEPHILKK